MQAQVQVQAPVQAWQRPSFPAEKALTAAAAERVPTAQRQPVQAQAQAQAQACHWQR